jgi:ubiquinone/menaquinone biosynthesis C-methylase UbiE
LALARWGAGRVVGIDNDPRVLRTARRRARQGRVEGVEFHHLAAERLGDWFEPAAFDAAVDTLLLNNLSAPQIGGYSAALARVVRPNGVLLVQERISRRAFQKDARSMPPPPELSRYFSFGTTVASVLPEFTVRSEGRPYAHVAVSVGYRNRRRAAAAPGLASQGGRTRSPA